MVALTPEQSKLGGVETYAEARKCAELFRANRDSIDGVLVCLPNFGDEKGVADTLKMAQLNVPVLVQGLSRRPELPWASPAGGMRSAARSPSATT
jgi:L-fucose isomerase-like protein